MSASNANSHDEIYAPSHAHPSSENESSQLDFVGGSKQKRRRTRFVLDSLVGERWLNNRLCSPRDHAILESAYQKNSKPDKEGRLNLVKQVDLGEKEVQVGFLETRRECQAKVAIDMVPEPPAKRSQKIEATSPTRAHSTL